MCGIYTDPSLDLRPCDICSASMLRDKIWSDSLNLGLPSTEMPQNTIIAWYISDYYTVAYTMSPGVGTSALSQKSKNLFFSEACVYDTSLFGTTLINDYLLQWGDSQSSCPTKRVHGYICWVNCEKLLGEPPKIVLKRYYIWHV